MVTSNKLPDKKVVKMSEQNNGVVVPQRTLLGEVNEHVTCPLCRGYYIDATTIVECLHSFCRSCIIKHLQVKSYCPVCEMMINSAKPNIKLDKALQDIVYKLVPGLFQKEMERRQTFYASRPGPAASATPEQRGEDTERIIFSPEDVISFSLEYADATDTDSISSKSSDSNEPQPPATLRRYLQCPAVVNISHLKKFLSMKFDIDSSQFAIDILYKRVPLPDYYTLMDIAYIYNWKRNEPMRFFYQIIDYVAIRNRLFDINRKGSHFRDPKSSPASTEDTNASSPAPNLNDQASEASSGTDSPMPDAEDNSSKDIKKHDHGSGPQDGAGTSKSTTKRGDDEVKKSQFLNSFELKAKSDSASAKSSPTKANVTENNLAPPSQTNASKPEDSLKRKVTLLSAPEPKKLKLEIERSKFNEVCGKSSSACNQPAKVSDAAGKQKEANTLHKSVPAASSATKPSSGSPMPAKDIKHSQHNLMQNAQRSDTKKPIPAPQPISSPNKKMSSGPNPSQNTSQKTVTPLKLQLSKVQSPTSAPKPDTPKPLKKMPDLKPTNVPPHNKSQPQPVTKLRMDLLANNSDPTIDRSKIMSQVKSSLSVSTPGHTSGDPLKSLFDSCKINIPSSLSITLTDQKQDPRNPETVPTELKKPPPVSKNTSNASNNAPSPHKVPTPPVHNYIEILKLPDTDPKKQVKPDGTPETKPIVPIKPDCIPTPPKPNKSAEGTAKGPVPNLKPISDTKLAKQAVATAAAAAAAAGGSPITFQQTFEQQLQSLQTDKKVKLPKSKGQVPKLVPATPKAFSAAKLNSSSYPAGIISALEGKSSAALDLSTPHPLQSQLTPHQTKAFETMQSIANLAKKQTLPSKGSAQNISQSFSSSPGRTLAPSAIPLRVPPPNLNQMKPEKLNPVSMPGSSTRQEVGTKGNQVKSTPSGNAASPIYPVATHSSSSPAQPSSRLTRSPSSSPKLVIAEEKQVVNPMEQNANQSNQITSTQRPSTMAPKSDSPKASPGPSKTHKPTKPPVPAANKIVAQLPKPAPNPPTDFQLMSAHQALLRHQMEMSAWLKAQRQFDLYKNMTNMAHQTQNDFNKDKK